MQYRPTLLLPPSSRRLEWVLPPAISGHGFLQPHRLLSGRTCPHLLQSSQRPSIFVPICFLMWCELDKVQRRNLWQIATCVSETKVDSTVGRSIWQSSI
ncbi:uncharacterized protein EI97DRAFT_134511 [Westerdykella ornata]|uniref:Uncharacterized protein n=1 Tax=Westerdykella ornata TaxID=318751 RepID=A0A6A6JBT7_WESOR|nr:uncharacterized protein EI97DRAFT_134511 [Westerdykella ornata]KAF2274041.1 hypothetical protein EI97DRAFT_134511 [Westerdykella ornata]